MSEHTLEGETEEEHLLGWAWGIIANAYGGDWDLAATDWRQAAEAWREDWHEYLEGDSTMNDSGSRGFQVGDKVTMFGAGPVWCKAEVAEIDRGGFRPIRVIWGANKAHTTDFHSSELTLVEPVKQWRPLPEGVRDGRDENSALFTKRWGPVRNLGQVAKVIEIVANELQDLIELRDHWPDFEETQGMEQ